MKKLVAPFFSIVVFTMIFFSTLHFYHMTQEIYAEKDKYRALKELSDIRGKLEHSINSTFLLINGFVAYATLNPTMSEKEFKTFSHELIKASGHIRNITLAPNNIIKYVYPKKNNEAVLGLNLSEISAQKDSIAKMIQDKKTVIAGPVDLVQGGKAFVNRTPIFINNSYWGMTSIPINMESIFEFAELKARVGDLDFALRGKDGLGEKGEVFFGDASLFTKKDTQILNIPLANGYWQLGVHFNELYEKHNAVWILYVGMFLSFVMALFVFYFISSLYLLSRTNEKMKTYIKIIDESVIISSTNLKGTIVYVSEAFCEISGFTKEELLNKNHHLIREPSMPKEIYTNLWKTIKNNEVWEGEIKNRRKDGTSYWVKAKISPVFDEDGQKIGYTSIREDITDKKIIEEISITDGLTNIYNRRYFNEMFPKIINSAKRTNDCVNFLLLDIDNFKLYNDNYGHQKGDEVLVNFAKCLKENLHRADDYVFRLGGEEFGIVYKTSNKEKAIEFAQKLRHNIEELKLVHEYNTASHYITASIGLVCKNSQEEALMDDIYKEADDLLYLSKKEGRNKVTWEKKSK